MPLSVVQLDLTTTTVLRGANTLDIDAGYVSMPHAIAFPTEQGRTAYGFFMPPRTGMLSRQRLSVRRSSSSVTADQPAQRQRPSI